MVVSSFRTYRVLHQGMAACLIVILFPFMLVVSSLIALSSPGPIIFTQNRSGHKKKTFRLYKFRTMINGADVLKKKYSTLNEADGPVFKIKKDPRFTLLGRFLSRSHIDELPQLWNIIKGDMLFVGFRPPTLDEVKHYKKWQLQRFNGYPGITSPWAVQGGHETHSFNEWITSDLHYESKRTLYQDYLILLKTIRNFLF